VNPAADHGSFCCQGSKGDVISEQGYVATLADWAADW
jgi:hypothetical protein